MPIPRARVRLGGILGDNYRIREIVTRFRAALDRTTALMRPHFAAAAAHGDGARATQSSPSMAW